MVIASSVGTYLAYLELERRVKKTDSIMPELTIGEQSFVVRSAGMCVGEFKTQVGRGKGYDLNTQGEVMVKLGAKLLPIKVSVSGEFNALGQSGGMIIKVTTPTANVVAGFTGINPLEITLSIRSEKYNNRVTFDYPGPVLLKRVGQNSYRLEARTFKLPSSLSNIAENQPFLKQLAIEIKEEEGGCGEQIGSLDLTPYLMLVSQAARFLPQGGA